MIESASPVNPTPTTPTTAAATATTTTSMVPTTTTTGGGGGGDASPPSVLLPDTSALTSSSSSKDSAVGETSFPARRLTPAELIQIAQTLETMKNSGLDNSDPRYQALLRVLKAHSNELQGLIRQQQQQANLATKAYPQTSTEMKEGVTVQPLPNAGMISDKVATNGVLPSKPAPTRPFTQEQLAQLRAQILAYKYLSRNLALPPALLAAIRSPNTV
jgi:hypothetical protein